MTDYVARPVERFGRRIKLEYAGMVSVYIIIALLVFRGLASWYQVLWAALGALLLFLGLKKKTRDHLSGSLVLMAAAWLARPAVVGLEWAVPFLLFAACVCAMEGYVEKRQEQILALPVIFLVWGWFGLAWVPAFLFVVTYAAHPWAEKPGLRRRLAVVLAVTVVAPWIGLLVTSEGRLGGLGAWLPVRVPLGAEHLAGLAAFGLPVLVCLALYWRRLILPHRIHPLAFALAAPWDVRLAAMFAMSGAVLLTATVFRLSIDSARLRPLFKHAEWHYFWYVLAVAIWVVLTV